VTLGRGGCYRPDAMGKPGYTAWGIGPLGLSLCLFLGLAFGGCKSIKKRYEDHFKDTYAQQFNTACVKRAMQERVTEARARSYCACAVRYLTDHNDIAELVLVGMTSSAASKRALDAATRTCQLVE
jgi:hypothetical protein